MGNNSDKLAGKAKEVAGKLKGDKGQELKGKIQHDAAELKDKAEDAAKDVGDKAKDFLKRAEKKFK